MVGFVAEGREVVVVAMMYVENLELCKRIHSGSRRTEHPGMEI